MTSSREHPPAAAGAKCPIVLACDENYAMPLATTLRSLVEANARHWPLQVTVLTDGLAERTKGLVAASLPPGSVSLTWRLIDVSRFAHLSLMSHVSRMTFARFEIEHAFGGDVKRVVYLDTDTLVLGDLGPLFEVDLGAHVLAAVADDHIDAAIRAGDSRRLKGVPDLVNYFNAGVLLIELSNWRRFEISQRAILHLQAHPHLPYSDQDALNAVCASNWLPLESKWNHQDHFATRIEDISPDKRPAIVHFITARKPWLTKSVSPNRDLYNRFKERTKFSAGLLERMHSSITFSYYSLIAKYTKRKPWIEE